MDRRREGVVVCCFFFFKAEDGIGYLVRSRGLGDVYKRQVRHILHKEIVEGQGWDGVPSQRATRNWQRSALQVSRELSFKIIQHKLKRGLG